MKTTHIILAAVLAATSAMQVATAEHKLPAPLPEFKTPEQLAKWRQEMTAKAAAADALAAKQANSAPSTSAFYTGKPFVDETGSYSFIFRQYDPEHCRWTTTDPSGFPDGANNMHYAAVPTSEYDYEGLASRPTPSSLWNAYPNYNTTQADVWAMAGGWLNDKYLAGDSGYQNSCALRLSIGLNGAGQAISKNAPGANLCEGQRYIISAASILQHITASWGSADESLSSGGLGALQGRLSNGAIAVVINSGHVGIVTENYNDQYTPYTYAGSMSVWLLE